MGKTFLSELELKEVEQAYDDEQAEIDARQQLSLAAQEADLSEAEVKLRHMREAGPEGMFAASETAAAAAAAPKNPQNGARTASRGRPA